MIDLWYEVAAAGAPLTQGDWLRDCRILDWLPSSSPALADWATERTADVVVMTQACDLEHHKVENVVLCPTTSLTAFRSVWEQRLRSRNQNPSEKSWRRMLEDVANGLVWNQFLLDAFDHPDCGTDVHVVEFQHVFTVPRTYLEQLLTARGKPRLRLRPPYREHLSQSFARFFMRVGLPQAVTLPA